MTMDGAVMRMRALAALNVPGRGEAAFAPSVGHLMFEGVTAPFQEGETITVTLHFERRGDIRVDFPVQWSSSPHMAHDQR